MPSAEANKMIEKLSFIERRLMAENMKPHECVRQLVEVFTTFKQDGDPTWPLRSIRDIILEYMRSLSMRYPAMTAYEKDSLIRLILHEAGEAKAKAKAKAKALAKGEAKETPEDSGELEEVGEPADPLKDA